MGESGLEIDWHGEDFVPKELLDIMLDDDENVNGDQISELASNDDDNGDDESDVDN